MRWRDVVVLHRLQFPLPVTYVCYAAWGAAYALGSPAGLAGSATVLAVAANLLFIVGALALNNVADLGIDSRHAEKGYLARATRRLGTDRALRWAVTELATGLALCLVLWFTTGRWVVAALAVAIVVLTLGYNVEPVRLKRRGVAGPLVFGTSLVGLPFLLSYTAVGADVAAWTWLVFAGVTVLTAGRTVWWSVPDRAADTADGVATPSARYGVPGTLVLACLVLFTGLVVLAGGLWWRYGALGAFAGVAAHAAFLGGVAALLRAARAGRLPTASRLHRRGLPFVVVGEVLLLVVPLAA
ncbi:4-hydroxybenzoate polyprenyltransferase [Prauserella shujinwangii]|uniref:4-hydroxybenzoate polyprenyltransferase n=1 Tax=Prauserella shujinwangii TaxID=1453103 RepID=A0A2T0LL94_9PSEU|nr:4-hydroxybenzoate polyprenyltransferase [Prauserella shujinwangii]